MVYQSVRATNTKVPVTTARFICVTALLGVQSYGAYLLKKVLAKRKRGYIHCSIRLEDHKKKNTIVNIKPTFSKSIDTNTKSLHNLKRMETSREGWRELAKQQYHC